MVRSRSENRVLVGVAYHQFDLNRMHFSNIRLMNFTKNGTNYVPTSYTLINFQPVYCVPPAKYSSSNLSELCAFVFVWSNTYIHPKRKTPSTKWTAGKTTTFQAPLSERQDNVTHVKNNERATGQETNEEKKQQQQQRRQQKQKPNSIRCTKRMWRKGPFIDFHSLHAWTYRME